MPSARFPRYRVGDPLGEADGAGNIRLDARAADRLNRVAEEIERLGRLSGPLVLADGPEGRTLGRDIPASTWAILDGPAGTGTSPYTFARAERSGGAWRAVTGAPTEGPAYEARGQSGLGGQVVRVFPAGSPGESWFVYNRYGSAEGCDDRICVVIVGKDGPISGRSVTIERQDPATGDWSDFASGPTGAGGCLCASVGAGQYGKFRATVADGSCAALTGTASVMPCLSADIGFRLCCWKACLQPASGGDPCCTPWTESGGVTSATYSMAGPGCLLTLAPPVAPRLDMRCQNDGFWPVCDEVDPYCNDSVTVTATDYSVADYVLNRCCGTCTNSHDRSAVVPRRIFATFSGPAEVFGGFSGASIALDLAGDSDDGTGPFTYPRSLHWTATLGAPGNDWYCWLFSGCTPVEIACGVTFAAFDQGDAHPWTGVQVDVTQVYGSAPNGGCSTYVSWQLLGRDLSLCPPDGLGRRFATNAACSWYDCRDDCGNPYIPARLAHAFFPVRVSLDSNNRTGPDWTPVGEAGAAGDYRLCGPVDYSGGDAIDASGWFDTVGGALQFQQAPLCGGSWGVVLSE
jgi:hypothetical protein